MNIVRHRAQGLFGWPKMKELSPKIIYIYQFHRFFKIMFKLLFKTVVGNYGFNFKIKTVINNYVFKIAINNYVLT